MRNYLFAVVVIEDAACLMIAATGAGRTLDPIGSIAVAAIRAHSKSNRIHATSDEMHCQTVLVFAQSSHAQVIGSRNNAIKSESTLRIGVAEAWRLRFAVKDLAKRNGS